MYRQAVNLITLLGLLIVENLFVVSPVLAASGSQGQGLEISPPVIELQANPGDTLNASVNVRNITQQPLIAKGRADDFGAGKGENGEPQLLLDETGATRYSLKFWIKDVPDITLAPQELKKATVSIHVPDNAEPGGHFGVIRFSAVPPDMQGTGVALSASVGTLILLKVAGTIDDKLSLTEFSSWQNKRQTNFFEYGPVDFLVRAKNDGSVHEKAMGDVLIKDTFGHKVADIAVNSKGGNVLPGSIRRFDQSLAQKQLFGHYSATLSLTYASSKKLTSTITFWVIPWRITIAILIGLIVFIYLLRVAIRKYNDHIINMARRR